MLAFAAGLLIGYIAGVVRATGDDSQEDTYSPHYQ